MARRKPRWQRMGELGPRADTRASGLDATERVRRYLEHPPAQIAVPGLLYSAATDEAKQRIYRHQQFKCAICERPGPQNLDHEHETGRVRGLLCIWCNRVLAGSEGIERFRREGWRPGKSDEKKPKWLRDARGSS